jgi:hypothetical protein
MAQRRKRFRLAPRLERGPDGDGWSVPHAFSPLACADLCGLRMVKSAYNEAPEFFNDERDALRANQAQTEIKTVSFSLCCLDLCDVNHRLWILSGGQARNG